MTRLIEPTSEQATPRTISSRYESTWTLGVRGVREAACGFPLSFFAGTGFAGITSLALVPSFPRRRESTIFGSRVLVLHLTPYQRE